MKRYVIIGMGAAGIAAAETIRHQDPAAEIIEGERSSGSQPVERGQKAGGAGATWLWFVLPLLGSF